MKTIAALIATATLALGINVAHAAEACESNKDCSEGYFCHTDEKTCKKADEAPSAKKNEPIPRPLEKAETQEVPATNAPATEDN